MRKCIIAWVKSCEGCIPAAVRLRESSGLNHSWPATTPFAILSVDIWKPGDVRNGDGFIGLLNSMCDLTQFVVMAPVVKLEASYIARVFMENVLLKFGLCALVVIDEGKEFCGLFRTVCRMLNIKCHVVAKRNHKAVGVERFHRFLNHSQRICAEERGTPASFVECGLTTAYAWNASHIDGTEIVRSLPAIGRILHFPIDIHEDDTLKPIHDVTPTVVDYIRHLGRDVPFSRELLAWMVTDRREAHRERVNDKRKPVEYKVGDIVMGRVSVQSSKDKGVSQKMVYQSRGPFVIERVTGHDTYYVRKYGKPQSVLQKFLVRDLYLLPPQILPCEHVDTPTLRYLNSDYAPLRHPFGKNFNIESYNTSWFDDKPVSRPPDFLLDSKFFDDGFKKIDQLSDYDCKPALDTEPSAADTINLCDGNDMSTIIPSTPTVKDSSTELTVIPTIDEKFYSNLDSSADKLFFVTFTPSDTLRPKWFLIQIVPLEPDDTPLPSGVFFCTFFQKHPKDIDKSDNESRWWPEWRELIWKNEDEYEFGERILFAPSQKPNLHSFGKFGTTIDFNQHGVWLTGPFDFLEKDHSRPGNSLISDEYWEELNLKCQRFSLVQPVLSCGLTNPITRASSIRATLNDSSSCANTLCYSSLQSMSYLFRKQRGTPRPLRNARKSA